ncbi:MAG: septum formation initiator family protein [Bacteroidales bacterium]|nr:septum formation initiator family protein [Bacteroidales bacterium]
MELWSKIKNYIDTSSGHGLVPFSIIITVSFFLYLCFGNGNNLTDFFAARAEINRNERQIAIYRAKMNDLGERQKAITSNPDSLEKLAREKYHLCAPDEDIYIIK